MQPNKPQMLRVLITPDRIVLFIRTSKHLWCPVCVHLSFHTLLCQGVWNYPLLCIPQRKRNTIANSVYCKRNKMHHVLSEARLDPLLLSQQKWAHEKHKRPRVWKEDDVKPVPPFLCHALLPFNHASVYVFQSVLLLFTEPKHDTQAIHCDPSSLSVKLVRVAWTVTLTIHHVYPATLY